MQLAQLARAPEDLAVKPDFEVFLLAQQRPADAVATLDHQSLPVNAAMLDLATGLRQAATPGQANTIDPAKIAAILALLLQRAGVGGS